MKGGFGCSPCCGPTCEACTRTCTEPHSASAFEVVYTRKFEGVEVGNTTDGYLTATGDSDTSDPYDGMDGSGPWYQQVGGGFNDGGSAGGGTRFPCTYRFSFWRSNYTLGASTIPPASTALTKNVITVNVSSGAVVFPDGRVFTSADGPVELASIPLVSGGASASDPRTNEGTVSFALQCQNVETQFSVQARIEWATQKRQHVLYGIVRECYEEGEPCATICGGTSPPSVVYLDVDNISLSGSRTASSAEATYVLERVPSFCSLYEGSFVHECQVSGVVGVSVGWSLALSTSMFGEASPKTLLMSRLNIVNGPGGTACTPLYFFIPEASIPSLCAPVSASDTNGVIYDLSPYFFPAQAAVIGSFSWSLYT